MKKCFIVYYEDRTANVVLCESMQDIPVVIGHSKFSSVVKVELIPFEVL